MPPNDELFQQLTASLKEGGAILRGETQPSRETKLPWPDARVVLEKLGLSQAIFAALIGISPRTLQNWEQGHSRPEGTACALLRIAERHLQAVLEALHAYNLSFNGFPLWDDWRRSPGTCEMASDKR